MSADEPARRLAGGAPSEGAAPVAKSEAIRLGAVKLFHAVLTDGHPRLHYNVQGARSVFDQARGEYDKATYSSEWRPARVRLANGEEVERKITPHLVHQHVIGNLSIAVESPAMTSRLVFDFDQRRLPPGAPEEQLLEVQVRHHAQLAEFWESIGANAEKQPVLQRSPTRTNFHVDLPLDRPYPAHWLRYFAERHAKRHGFRVEVFPSGKPIRAPVGKRMALLVPRNPDRAAELQLEARHVYEVHSRLPDGTYKAEERRRVLDYLTEYLARYEAARRPLCEWIPDAPAWDELTPDGRVHFGPWGSYEDDAFPLDEAALIQHTEDTGGWAPGGPSGSGSASLHPAPAAPVRATRGREGVRRSGRSSVPIPGSIPGGVTGGLEGSAVEAPGAGMLLHGREWRETIESLLTHGLREPGTRHNSVLKLTWHWASEGCHLEEVLLRMERWCRGHNHESEYIRKKGLERFVKRARYDAQKYFLSHCVQLAPRRAEGLRSPAPLSAADVEALATVMPAELLDEGLVLLGVLAAYADCSGRVASPVRLSGAMLCGLLGDRRLADDGDGRRRLHVVLLEALQRAGILTLHRNYAVGSHGREYSCWYHFGSGRLPQRQADGQLQLATRLVQEGRVAAVCSGEPGAPARADLVELLPNVVDRPRAWWRRMFARRAGFTPGEFLDADEKHVLPFPSPARNPVDGLPAPYEVLERLGWRIGRVRSFSYAACFGHVALDDGSLAFIHQTDIDEDGWRDLKVEEEVSFELVRTPRGQRALGLWRVRPERPGRDEPSSQTPVDAPPTGARSPGEPPATGSGEPSAGGPPRQLELRAAIAEAKARGDDGALRRLTMERLAELRKALVPKPEVPSLDQGDGSHRKGST